MKKRILKKFMKAYEAYDGRYREGFVSIMNKFAKHKYWHNGDAIRFFSKLNNLSRKFLRRHPNMTNPKFGYAILMYKLN